MDAQNNNSKQLFRCMLLDSKLSHQLVKIDLTGQLLAIDYCLSLFQYRIVFLSNYLIVTKDEVNKQPLTYRKFVLNKNPKFRHPDPTIDKCQALTHQ